MPAVLSTEEMSSAVMRKEALWVALSGALTLAVAMGIGRFAFTPLLPIMLHDGVINLTTGGWLATANYIGYFIGAMLCVILRGSPTHFIRFGLIATVLLTLGMGLSNAPDLRLLILLRTLSGITSSLVFVFASGWCLQRLTQLGAPALGGIIYCGPGIGILVTGLPASTMVAHDWSAAQGWLLFSALALVLSASVWRTFSKSADTPAPFAESIHASEPLQVRRQATELVLIYGVGGFGYIITATFLPVIARQALPHSHWPDLLWPLFGIGVAIGALLGTRIPMRYDNRLLLAICYVLQAIGVMMGTALPTVSGFAIGCLLLGLPFTAITLFAMREARRLYGDHARSLMGWLTAVYGLGQIIGPPLATYLVKRTGSFTASLSVAALALLAGACLFGMMVYKTKKAQT
ncbi:YbfB/YjiJ family MFS transporter [Glaciimonas sp. CA11.2]|uniref:YbfB/YjiJ family MFS transporter n=1 Tax=unclassified Glaciimonas TaxID=2644401 RepID=UPI002AB47404|nr:MULTISPECIES: YbfB/YjiJ family MFS transporter [unclassified Glaciimonas]MDY7546566.1 YbfB/YjiJ family MFS transporter [Glaciimonas sp. CA11.2]MEB0011692.1 YbfB/YjiJ family MFS transporter [Glaciimonas sp. Cout2]MEB0080752.1 YbfB/YjiJ family MFS transporter [Glaciimonas sp. Gout2]MEB0161799.1 YbfB/YjiJ family MFS transporter [Glaciimonas sp. CA11.2]